MTAPTETPLGVESSLPECAFVLPKVPDHPGECIADVWSHSEALAIYNYGLACAKAVADASASGLALLRSALSKCATAVGASATPDCSVEFLACVPREVELVVGKMRADQHAKGVRIAELEARAAGLFELHGRDSAELARLCKARDGYRAERDSLQQRIAADAERYAASLQEIGAGYQQEYAKFTAERDTLKQRVGGLEGRLSELGEGYLLLRFDESNLRRQLEAKGADAEHWQHIANEWADTACNALQWLRNIKDGISTPEESIEDVTLQINTVRSAQAAAGESQ